MYLEASAFINSKNYEQENLHRPTTETKLTQLCVDCQSELLNNSSRKYTTNYKKFYSSKYVMHKRLSQSSVMCPPYIICGWREKIEFAKKIELEERI